MNDIKKQLQQLAYLIMNPFIKVLIKLGITPNMITFFGFLLNVLSTVVLILGAEYGDRTDHKYIAYAGLIILLGGAMDMVDGRLARMSNQDSSYGALFDSVLDRYSELIMFLGFCYYFVTQDYLLTSIFCFIAMIGSIMVSYTRARAEGLGVKASVGLMQRPERIILVSVSSIVCGLVSYLVGGSYVLDVNWLPQPVFEPVALFSWPIFFLAVSANITALRRLAFAKKEMSNK